MPASARHRLAAGLSTLTLAGLGLVFAAPAHATVPNLGQHVAVPAYISPSTTAGSADWTKLSTSSSQLGFVVANVANGPDSAVNTDWQSVINATHNHGAKVLGYVDSGYFGFSTDHRQTQSGSTSAADWLTQAEQDVNRWYQFYGSSIDGIFFDDGENVCGPTAGSNSYADLYSQLNDYVHTYHQGSLTVVNPGVSVPQCYEDTADVIVSFEGSYADYQNPPAALAPLAWQLSADPNKFWNIVYNVPDQTALTATINKSRQDNAGYIYATNDGAPDGSGNIGNPYDTVPPQTYWNSELSGTAVTDSQTPVTPAKPYTSDVLSTSVDLGWTSNSASSAVGYDVYVGATKVGSVSNYTPGDTEFTVVGLTPNTTYSITVKSRDLAGRVSAASTALSVHTQSSFGSPPTAPGALASSATSANSTRLTWTASHDSDDYVAQYEVYQNGSRLLTVSPSTLSVTVEFLSPGTSYPFYVIARDSTGTPSAASSTVTVTTTNPAPIASPAGTFTASTLDVSAQYNLSYTFHHVFIDDGSNHATGYAFGGIVADFLFENGTFYVHDATQPGAYAWIAQTAPAGAPFLVSSTGGLWHWQVPSSMLTAGATSLQVVFDGSGGSAETTLAPITVTKH